MQCRLRRKRRTRKIVRTERAPVIGFASNSVGSCDASTRRLPLLFARKFSSDSCTFLAVIASPHTPRTCSGQMALIRRISSNSIFVLFFKFEIVAHANNLHRSKYYFLAVGISCDHFVDSTALSTATQSCRQILAFVDVLLIELTVREKQSWSLAKGKTINDLPKN